MSSLFRLGVPACVLLICSWSFAQSAGDPAEIAALRTKAEKGNSIAQYNLGLAYSSGRDLAVDLPEAFVWLTLAAENGTTGRVLENVLAQMTPGQLTDAQSRLAARRQALGLATTAATLATAAAGPGADVAQLEADKKQLSQELALAWQEADRLKAGLDEARTARDHALAELRASTTELGTLRATAAKLATNQSGANPAENQSLRQELETLRGTATALAQREQELEDIAAQRGRAADEARGELAAALARIAELNRTVSDLEGRLAAPDAATATRLAGLTEQLGALERRLGQSEADHADALAQLEQASRDLAATRARVVALETENTRLEKALAAAPKPGAHAEAEARLLQANSKRIEAEDKVRTLTAELASARAALAAADTPAGPDPALGAQLESLQAALTQHESDLAAARARNAELSDRLNTLQRELDADRSRISGLESENRTLLARTEDPAIAARIAELEQALAAARTEHTAAVDQLTALKSAPAAADHSAELAALENKLSTTLRSYTLLQEENDRLKASSDQLAAQMAALEHQLAGAHRDINDLSARLETSTTAAADTGAVAEQLRQVRDELNAVRQENSRLRNRLAALSPAPTGTLAAPTRPGSAQAVSLVAARPPATSTPPASPAATGGPRTHVVVTGDTLSQLSRQYYGTSLRWAEIYEANRDKLPNERALRVGMTLVIP